MYNDELLHTKTNNLLIEMENYINCLYVAPCPFTRNMVLNLLRQKISFLYFLNNLQLEQKKPDSKQPGQLPQKTFTLEELTRYNGRDGQPAYIAVNGIVYDVTNSAAWAAATHFGLTAGKDLSQQFAGCHEGQQQILNSLPVVGRLL